MIDLLVVVGPTASGKSGLAMHIAQQYNGELICADSRTIYKGMDIGTAKPSPEDQQLVRHHLLEIVAPDQSFNVSDFQIQAKAAISEIHARGHLPIVVGGTGLYVDALLYDFAFLPKADPAIRASLEAMSTEALQERIRANKLPMPTNEQNRRHLIRVLETNGQQPQRGALRPKTAIIGLAIPKPILDERIQQRVEDMFAHGLEHEVRQLVQDYGWGVEAMKAIGYHEFAPYLSGDQTIDALKQQIVRDTIQYAKRQRTWFKRNADIQWFDTIEQAEQMVQKLLNK